MEQCHKVLWINYDEKCFYGLVTCTNAKMCEWLGIEKAHMHLYHKNHIEKLIVVVFMAYTFDSNIENDGDRVKICLPVSKDHM